MLYLLILIPVLAGIGLFFVKDRSATKATSLFVSVIIFLITVWQLASPGVLHTEAEWLPMMGAKFSLTADGMAKMLCLLNAVSMPLILAGTYNNNYRRSGSFYALMFLTQAGMMGVFLAADVLLFYFFWELALIPAYFLASMWGGEKRIQAAFKFFVYTFIGSLLLLIGIIYLYTKTPDNSFAIASFANLDLSVREQNVGFWLFFFAFAIKMPIFPLHTWQPLAYQQSPTAATAVLSGVMVKMGIYAMLRFVLPVFATSTDHFQNIIMWAAIIGILYASLIAIRSNDLKKLVAYSSIAHIGVMAAAIFSYQKPGAEGVMLQMFNHGINVIGLWIVVNAIEQKLGTRKISELGGLAQKAPTLAILFTIMALANVSLPLTNAFVGEFLMFNGIFRHSMWMAIVACISIILVAVYTLNIIQNVFYGTTNALTEKAHDSNAGVNTALICIALFILLLGVYPEPILNLTRDTVTALFAR